MLTSSKILIVIALISLNITTNCFCQSKKLIPVIDSIVINELYHDLDSATIDLTDKQPIIIIDGLSVKRSQLKHIEIKDIKEIKTLSDTIASQIFDNGRYGVIIIRTKLSKRQLKKKL